MSDFGKIGSARVEIFADTKRLQTQMAGLSSKIKQMGRSIQNVGRTLTRNISLPLGAAGVATSKFAADFESEMTKVNSLVGATEGQVDQFKDQVKGLAGDVGKAPEELAEALFFVTSAGLEGSKAMETLEASAKASAAGLGETKQVADAATSVMNAYGAANVDAEQAVDTLVATVREGKVQTDELSGVIGQIVPITSELGIGFDEVGGALATMTRKGLDASKAATSLRGILRGILKPSEQGKKRLEEYGTSMAELRKVAGSQGLLPVLEKIKSEVGSNEEALSDIFPRVRGLIGVLSLVGDEAEGTQEVFNNVANSSGSMDRAFSAASETITQQFNEAWADLQSSMIEIGKVVAPIAIDLMEKLASFIKRAATRFSQMENPVQRAIVKISGLAIVLGPVLTAVGTLVTAFGGLVGTLTSLSGLGVAAFFTGLTAKISEFWNTNQSIGENLNRLWKKIKTTFVNNFDDIKNKAVSVKNKILKQWRDNFQPVFKKLFDALVTVVGTLKDAFLAMPESMRAFTVGLIAMSPRISAIITGIQGLSSVMGTLSLSMVPVVAGIGLIVGSLWALWDTFDVVTNNIGVVWTGITKLLVSAVTKILQKVKDLLEGLSEIPGVASMVEGSIENLGNLVDKNKKKMVELQSTIDNLAKASQKARKESFIASSLDQFNTQAESVSSGRGVNSKVKDAQASLEGLTMEADGRQLARLSQEHQTKEAGKRGTTVDL